MYRFSDTCSREMIREAGWNGYVNDSWVLIKHSKGLTIELILGEYQRLTQRHCGIIREGMNFAFIYFLPSVLTKNSGKILKISLHLFFFYSSDILDLSNA